MALTQAYLEWEERTHQEGIQIGQQALIRLTVENLFRTRFGSLDDFLQAVIQTFV